VRFIGITLQDICVMLPTSCKRDVVIFLLFVTYIYLSLPDLVGIFWYYNYR